MTVNIAASDADIQPDVQLKKGGNALVVRSGGQIIWESGAALFVNGGNVITQLNNNAVEGGTVAVVGSVAVVTGLTTVDSVAITQAGSTAPGVAGQNFTYEVTSGGTIEIYAWMPTSNSNPTLVANTGTVHVGWMA